jgi:hypothetical protein
MPPIVTKERVRRIRREKACLERGDGARSHAAAGHRVDRVLARRLTQGVNRRLGEHEPPMALLTAVRKAKEAEPRRQISCIRLSDKTSSLRPRHVVPKPAQTYEPEAPVSDNVALRGRGRGSPRLSR